MVFSNNQNTSFFENGPQMNLPVVIRNRLQLEGLATVEDLRDFREDELHQAFKNLRTPIAGVPGIQGIPAIMNAAGDEEVAAIQAVPPIPGVAGVLISAICSKRLKVASVAFHYYESIGRTHTPINMNFSNVLRAFHIEWEALLTLNEEDKVSVPVLSKQVPPLKWIKSFKNHLYNTFGIRKCPLLYVVREDAVVPQEADDLLPQQLHLQKPRAKRSRQHHINRRRRVRRNENEASHRVTLRVVRIRNHLLQLRRQQQQQKM